MFDAKEFPFFCVRMDLLYCTVHVLAETLVWDTTTSMFPYNTGRLASFFRSKYGRSVVFVISIPEGRDEKSVDAQSVLLSGAG